MTFSWLNLESLEDGVQHRLFGTRINGGTAGFEVSMENENGQALISVAGRSQQAEGSYRKVTFDASNMQPGAWRDVAATPDFATDEIRLYVDGEMREVVVDSEQRWSADSYQLGEPTGPDAI